MYALKRCKLKVDIYMDTTNKKPTDQNPRIKSETINDLISIMCNTGLGGTTAVRRGLLRIVPEDSKILLPNIKLTSNKDSDLNLFTYLITDTDNIELSKEQKNSILKMLMSSGNYAHAAIYASHLGKLQPGSKQNAEMLFEISKHMGWNIIDENGKIEIEKTLTNANSKIADIFSNFAKNLYKDLLERNVNYNPAYHWYVSISWAKIAGSEIGEQKLEEAIGWYILHGLKIPKVIINKQDTPKHYGAHLSILRR